MAVHSSQSDMDDVASPEHGPVTAAPLRSGDNYDFMLHTIMALQKSHGSLEQAIHSLTSAIEKQGSKIDKIDDKVNDMRVGVGKLEAEVSNLSQDHKGTKDKLDKVRVTVVGAAAVVAFVVIILGLVIKFLPFGGQSASMPTSVSPPVAAPQQSSPGSGKN